MVRFMTSAHCRNKNGRGIAVSVDNPGVTVGKLNYCNFGNCTLKEKINPAD